MTNLHMIILRIINISNNYSEQFTYKILREYNATANMLIFK